ncbi:uncharacterized protein PGTG_10171 [Puccinia graminis f. sp. tritici CRL 75-36-700-3]|uniref:Uncharacterized protein n=1 Tax=Puccinia graminis f. sp. tritici (strain CRL 75-36-700-3 / race SCCL) TaxID=418459 RepID=E3KJH6_PUCGT|nr:uncharacterized protein PGTG_10171 [Puccinia graminis f. sp. tritici CRL 75-36-700-3]EFP84451.1 hypothetical protein PGTG_10171 [Puccinia graminis f. sp. tritici CRL 75-36-700-3]
MPISTLQATTTTTTALIITNNTTTIKTVTSRARNQDHPRSQRSLITLPLHSNNKHSDHPSRAPEPRVSPKLPSNQLLLPVVLQLINAPGSSLSTLSILASRTPSPSPGSSALAKNSITSIKKNLVEILDRFACPLEDKLLLVAKLHAEVEAELTQLNELSVGPTYTTHNSRSSRHAHHESVDRSANHKIMGQTQTGQQNHSRKEIEDMVRLIKHADRIKAHALQQLKQDLSNSHSQSDPHPDPYTRPLHPPSVHTSNNSGRVALLNRTDLH